MLQKKTTITHTKFPFIANQRPVSEEFSLGEGFQQQQRGGNHKLCYCEREKTRTGPFEKKAFPENLHGPHHTTFTPHPHIMSSSSNPNTGAFVPAFYASSYDDDELEFSAEQVHSDNGVAFTAPAAPVAFSAELAHADAYGHDEDDDDALFVPKTMYRDTQHVFAHGPCDLVRLLFAV